MGDMLGHGIGLKVQQGLSMGRRMEVLGMEFGMCYDCSACATTAAHVQGLQCMCYDCSACAGPAARGQALTMVMTVNITQPS